MAIWYAQQSSTNIDHVSSGTTSDVWNAAADGSGAWMDISVLTAGGTDTVLAANGKTAININTDINIGTGRLSTAAEGGTAGGGFTVSAARTITANVLAGSTHALAATHKSGTVAIVGTVTGGTTNGAVANGIRLTAAGTLTISGLVKGGSGSGSYGVYQSAGVIEINGGLEGGSSYNAFGAHLFAGTLTINGHAITAGSYTICNGLWIGGGAFATANNCDLIHTAYAAATNGCIVYNPGPNNYIEYPTTTGTAKYGKTIPAASVLSGVDGDGADAPATGTVTLPSEADVKSGVEFGASGALTGDYVNPPHIRKGISY